MNEFDDVDNVTYIGRKPAILKTGGECDDCGAWHDGSHEKDGGIVFGLTFCVDCEDKRLGLVPW